MSKKVYLIIFIILCFNGWGIRLIPYLSSTIWLGLQVLLLLIGFIYWSRKENNTWGKRYLGAFRCIVIGIVLSMIPALLYYDQSIWASVVAYRRQILWLAIPVLLRIAPSEDDILGAAKVSVFMIWGVLLLRMFAPGFLYLDAETIEKFQETGNYGYVLGFTLALIPLYYYVGRVSEEGIGNPKIVLWIVACYALLFVMRNRSMLFASSVVILISILRMRSRNKPIILFLVGLAVGLFLAATADVWTSLLSRTQLNLADEEYNRNIAYTYFLTQANTHVLQYVLGHGYISSHASSLVETLQSLGIYNSDVGFIGFWNEYGILPIIAFTYMSFVAIFDKVVPSYVSMMGLTILICSPTMSYFGYITTSIVFIIMYYLVCYFQYKAISEKESLEIEEVNSE